jgi:hypothetical protein
MKFTPLTVGWQKCRGRYLGEAPLLTRCLHQQSSCKRTPLTVREIVHHLLLFLRLPHRRHPALDDGPHFLPLLLERASRQLRCGTRSEVRYHFGYILGFSNPTHQCSLLLGSLQGWWCNHRLQWWLHCKRGHAGRPGRCVMRQSMRDGRTCCGCCHVDRLGLEGRTYASCRNRSCLRCKAVMYNLHGEKARLHRVNSTL